MVQKAYKAAHRIVSNHWLTVAFFLGFIVDTLTLTRIDRIFDNAILFTYIVLAMLSIYLLYAAIAEKFSDRVNDFLKRRTPFVMQYAFGGLLSGMLIFYGRSSSLSDSWLFILLIIGVIIGNETIKDRAHRLVYNLTIFFIGIFSYAVLIVPVVLGMMGPWIFLLSGALAVSFMYGFVRILQYAVPNFIYLQKRKIVFIMGLIFVGLNTLYFTNVIPPIPLSLKHLGVYHSVVRYDDGTYALSYEKPAWWEWYRRSDKEFHPIAGDNIYCYASVFAPSRLAVKIFHRWEQYEPATDSWRQHGRFAYAIQGGRDDGYRGYTLISNFSEGTWRCTVETERGQVLGRETFTVESGPRAELVTKLD